MKRKKALEDRQTDMRARSARSGGRALDLDDKTMNLARAKLTGYLLHTRGRSPEMISLHFKRMFALDIPPDVVEEWIAKGCPLVPSIPFGSSTSDSAR